MLLSRARVDLCSISASIRLSFALVSQQQADASAKWQLEAPAEQSLSRRWEASWIWIYLLLQSKFCRTNQRSIRPPCMLTLHKIRCAVGAYRTLGGTGETQMLSEYLAGG